MARVKVHLVISAEDLEDQKVLLKWSVLTGREEKLNPDLSRLAQQLPNNEASQTESGKGRDCGCL